MPVTEGEWQSIRALVERTISQTGAQGSAQVITTQVVKTDDARKVIYVPEYGDQPVPLVDFNGDGRFYDSDIPLGSITQWADDVLPDGWVEANGQAISRTGYSELFALLGTDYGPGDGSTTFNVPLVTGGAGGGEVEEWHGGSGAPSGALGIVGDWYLNYTNGDVYEKTGASAWTLRANIKGPTGATGSAGTPGEKWFTGSGAPSGATGIVGDWYLDSANGDYYEKTGTSTWTLRGNLRGPTGPQGIQGVQGPQGATGQAEGWYSGSGAPTGALGAVGDWYLDFATGDVYEKTGASAWTARGNIRGPQGPTGSQGPQGTAGEKWFSGAGAPSGATGAVSDWYLDSTSGDFYEKTGASTWTLRGHLKGSAGAVLVYEQPAQPSPDPASGALWIDTDAPTPTPPAYQGPPLVSALPVSPTDGQEIYYLVDATLGIVWHLRYRAASASAYKWEFLGGSTLRAEVATQESTTLNTYTALATPGPSVALPLAGDYIISHGAELHTGGASGNAAIMSYDIGATAAVDADSATNYIGTGAAEAAQCFRQKRKNGLAAVTLTAKYKSNISGQITFYTKRTLEARPVRVG